MKTKKIKTFSDYVTENLDQSVEIIDRKFGKGYAKKNPVLIAGFMQSASIDLLMQEVVEKLDDLKA